ncbi:uncharacterized protein F4812DRAFT_4107 [Daldinia caldariorum]|uniref:uncharacterized protein n=1 Tax=Daldinia caldariorum TaxID=326644 RepID=UPI00200832B1|nr:uncharacterized protein F4812DRAFT_4107 [Daldinia caldariorum]KAI1472240.1 hypothetical protein F4812DRAFT_4107 [Daldinia caldariorum]
MFRLHRAAILGLSLSASVLGAALPAVQNDCLTNAAGCAVDTGLKLDVSGSSSTPTGGSSPLAASCWENQLRCNEHWEEICDNDTKWKRLMRCESCTEDLVGGDIDCVPYENMPPEATHTPECVAGALRCQGTYLDLCGADHSWERIEKCGRCVTDPDGQTFCDNPEITDTAGGKFAMATAAPGLPLLARSAPTFSALGDASDATPVPSSHTPRGHEVDTDKTKPCTVGTVRCTGDRVQGCTGEQKWHDFGPCPDCEQLDDNRVDCKWKNLLTQYKDPMVSPTGST